GRDVEELVAEAGEDQPADVRPADGGMERVGIVVEADAQNGFGGGGTGRQQRDREPRDQQAVPSHGASSSGFPSGLASSVPRASTATAPSPARRTMSGLISRSTSRGPRSAASQDTRTTASATAAPSSGGRQHPPSGWGPAGCDPSPPPAR